MIGIVVVSHSKKLAQEVIEFVSEMKFNDFPLLNGGGTSDNRFGSDPMIIKDAIEKAYLEDGVMVFCDIGSSILNTKIAIDFLDQKFDKDKVIIADAPIVEGTLVAVVSNTQESNVVSKIQDELNKLKNTSKLD